MRYLVLCVCNILNIVAFHFKIRKVHTSLSIAFKVIAVYCNGAICSTEGFTKLLGITLLLGLPVLSLLITKRKKKGGGAYLNRTTDFYETACAHSAIGAHSGPGNVNLLHSVVSMAHALTCGSGETVGGSL